MYLSPFLSYGGLILKRFETDSTSGLAPPAFRSAWKTNVLKSVIYKIREARWLGAEHVPFKGPPIPIAKTLRSVIRACISHCLSNTRRKVSRDNIRR